MKPAETPDPVPDAVPPKRESRFAREITSIVGAPILIWAVGWAPVAVFCGIAVLAASVGLWEFLAMGKKKGLPMQTLLSTTLLLVLLAAFLVPQLPLIAAIFATMIIVPTAYVFSRGEIERALPASGVTILAILYVGLLSGALIRVRLDFEPHGAELVFFLFLVVWLGDALAYYTGKNFGRTKLLPRVSPKKTVEGLIGGITGSVIAATVIHFTFFPAFILGHALVCAVLLSISGVVGDLAESVWKRSAGVKDSGALIPGHGGILDRLDSILFTAPILYAYWYLLHEPLTL